MQHESRCRQIKAQVVALGYNTQFMLAVSIECCIVEASASL